MDQNHSLTSQQQVILENFRIYVKNDKFDDAYLLRYLNSRQFDLQKTIIKWDAFIQWRKEKDVDNIKQFEFSEIEEVRKYYPHGYHKTDKNGRPIYIEKIGKINVVELFKVTTPERMLTYMIQVYEYLINSIFPACSKQAGKLIDKSLIIMDLKDVQLGMLPKVKSFIQMASNLGKEYYPECLGTMYFVNAPFLFSTVWSGIKIFLDPNTQNKIKILGSNYKNELLQVINEENLPDFLGGSASVILHQNIGPWNPLGLELYGKKELIKEKNKGLQIHKSQPSLGSYNEQQILQGQQNQSSWSDQEFHSIMDLEIDNNFDFNQSSISNNEQIGRKQSFNLNQVKSVFLNDNPNTQQTQEFKTNNILLNYENKHRNAVELYRDIQIENQNTKEQKIQLKQLFDEDLVKLSVNQVNKNVQDKFQLYAHNKPRFFNLFIYSLCVFSVFLVQNTFIPNADQMANYFSRPKSHIYLCNIMYIIFYGISSFLLRNFKQNYSKTLFGIAVSILGVWLRQIDSYYFLIIGHTLLAICRPFITNYQQDFIMKWFPPQERYYSHVYIAFVALLGNVVGFYLPSTYEVSELLFLEAVIFTSLNLLIVIFYKQTPDQVASFQNFQSQKQQQSDQNYTFRTIPMIIFIISQAIFKCNVIFLPSILEINQFEQNEISSYLCQFIFVVIIINIFLQNYRLNAQIKLSLALSCIICGCQFYWIDQKTWTFVNIGFFLISPILLNYQQRNIKFYQKRNVQCFCTLFANLFTVILIVFIYNIIDFSQKQDVLNYYIIFCSLMIFQLVISFCYDFSVDDQLQLQNYDNVDIIKKRINICEQLGFCL